MSFDPPAGILDIGNATLRVGKLEVAETTGLSQGLQNIIKNDLLITENETYSSDQKWGLKLPNNWVSEFELKGVSGKYLEFNFYNEGSSSNTLGYTLNFKDTTLSLRYDNGSWTTATIPTIVDTYRKVNVFFERNVISVTMDGTQVLYYKHTGTPPPVMSRVTSATGGAFINLFVESTAGNPEFKNLRIVNGRFISDQTSNIAFMGGNLGVGVNSPQEALDIRGNMHFNRASNVSQVSVDSNVVTEYTGPHDRPLRKYPEVVLTADDNLSTLGYKASVSSLLTGNNAFNVFDVTGATTYWHSQYPYYTHVTGTYNPGQSSSGTGTPSGTLPTTELISGHQGEWIKLQMPTRIKLEEVRVYASNRAASSIYQMPKDIAIAGSNDGTNWYLVDSGTLRTGIRESYGMASLPITTSSYYSYLALIVKTIDNQGANYSAVEVAGIEYYGREEGDASLDTTLKSVYNAPATTGTQLEVYYDGQDYTGLTSTVTDKVGNSNSTISSGSDITFDSTWKAWTFGSNTSRTQTFRSGTLPTSLTSISYISAALWFKLGTTTGDRTFFFISDPEANRTANEFLELRINANQDYRFSLWDGEYTWRFQPPFFAEDSYDVPTGEWYHIVLSVKDASSTGRKLYFNGVECDLTDAGSRLGVASSTELNLPSDAILEIGRRPGEGVGNTVHDATNEFDGSIANFRLYGKALNAGQAKELYDYQKDYFLGSKSQVTLYKGHLGVGVTEPSGQLELAGDERIQEYPPGPMTDFGTNIPGHGMFKVYASSWLDNGSFKVWQAFDKSRDSVGWHDTDTPYTNGSPNSNARSLGGIKGEWIALELPYAVNLKAAATVPRTGYEMRGPGSGVILGSNDGSNWDQLHSFSGLTSTNEIPTYVGNITAPGYYTTFALVVTKLTGAPSSTNTNSLNLSEIKFFGTPGSTTLDKGSLSLTRNLDVPRLSRYDVDTETPRPEKLVVDYDTDVHPFNFTSVKDKSGRGNNAFSLAGAIYSPPDKAFKFDGTDDTLYAEHPTGNSWGNAGIGFPTGDARYTMSCWIKKDTTSGGHGNPAVFYVGSSWATYKLAGIYLRDGNKLAADIGSASVYTTNAVINAGQWHHIAIVKRGQGALSTSQSYMGLFVDGVEIAAKSQDNNYVQALDTVDHLSIGNGFNGSMGSFGSGFKGCISKPQAWSVALEPSEILKIYRLGRVGRSIVLADTNLQIGAGQHSSVTSPPYATLDVHGHALISGELHSMEGNFHKMLGFARGGGHADHQRTDNCLVAMAGTTLSNTGHAYVSFAIRKSPNWMPFFVETYHCGVDHDSSDIFNRVSHSHGRIYQTNVDAFNSASNVSYSASDMGGDMVRFRIFVNRENRYYGVTMVKFSYYYGIRGRMD